MKRYVNIDLVLKKILPDLRKISILHIMWNYYCFTNKDHISSFLIPNRLLNEHKKSLPEIGNRLCRKEQKIYLSY